MERRAVPQRLFYRLRSYARSVIGGRPIEPRSRERDSAETAGDEALRVAAHDAAVVAGEAGYLDAVTGLFVFTAEALRARRSCCESGCRHCPYGVSGR